MKLCELEKASLGIFPTPLQKMENLTKEIGCGDLYIKRDDLTDVGLSGNKIRKLEYLVAQAKACLLYTSPKSSNAMDSPHR